MDLAIRDPDAEDRVSYPDSVAHEVAPLVGSILDDDRIVLSGPRSHLDDDQDALPEELAPLESVRHRVDVSTDERISGS